MYTYKSVVISSGPIHLVKLSTATKNIPITIIHFSAALCYVMLCYIMLCYTCTSGGTTCLTLGFRV